MAKYSTGSGGGGGSGDACELCGREDASLSEANVAGARLSVCSDCAPHDDSARTGGSGRGEGGGRDDDEPSRRKRAAQNVAKAMDASDGDSRRWEEQGTDYEDDRLPYLVDGYGEAVTEARQDAGMTAEDLADEVGVDAERIHAVEDGRAARAGVGGSTVRGIEQALDVALIEE